jgi:hypothetical protein
MTLRHAAGRTPVKAEIADVPRYFRPYIADCFVNAYAALMAFHGRRPEIVLADYMSFMYDEETGYVGVNHLYQYSATVEFTEEELNTAWEFVYSPATSVYDPKRKPAPPAEGEDRFFIHLVLNDDPAVAYERTKERIDSGEPVVAIVDMFDIPYHRAYGREHGIHAVVLVGYDEEKREYRLFDNYPISSSDFDGTLTFDEIAKARSAVAAIENPMSGPVSRPIRNLWAEVHVGQGFHVSEERVRAIFRKSFLRMRGLQTVTGRECGLNRLEALRRDILAKKDQPLDERDTFLFRTYYTRFFKNVSRQRKRFKVFVEELLEEGFVFPDGMAESLGANLETAGTRWEIAANVSLKLGITRKPALLEELAEQIAVIHRTESEITGLLEECAAQVRRGERP